MVQSEDVLIDTPLSAMRTLSNVTSWIRSHFGVGVRSEKSDVIVKTDGCLALDSPSNESFQNLMDRMGARLRILWVCRHCFFFYIESRGGHVNLHGLQLRLDHSEFEWVQTSHEKREFSTQNRVVHY